jgi:hypothetical protein
MLPTMAAAAIGIAAEANIFLIPFLSSWLF